jgi:hypothetical protein
VFGANTSNELRIAWAHLSLRSDPQDRTSLEMPSIEIAELGMSGFLAARSRTAIGLATNLPNSRYDDLYQVQNTFTHVRGPHLIKAGFDVRYQYMKSLFSPTTRGQLRYLSLDASLHLEPIRGHGIRYLQPVRQRGCVGPGFVQPGGREEPIQL